MEKLNMAGKLTVLVVLNILLIIVHINTLPSTCGMIGVFCGGSIRDLFG